MSKTQKAALFIFIALSIIVFVNDWSKFGFTHTATVGAGAVALHSLTYAFTGAFVGGVLGLLIMLGYKIFSGKARFPHTLFLSIWGFFLLTSLYTNFIR